MAEPLGPVDAIDGTPGSERVAFARQLEPLRGGNLAFGCSGADASSFGPPNKAYAFLVQDQRNLFGVAGERFADHQAGVVVGVGDAGDVGDDSPVAGEGLEGVIERVGMASDSGAGPRDRENSAGLRRAARAADRVNGCICPAGGQRGRRSPSCGAARRPAASEPLRSMRPPPG